MTAKQDSEFRGRIWGQLWGRVIARSLQRDARCNDSAASTRTCNLQSTTQPDGDVSGIQTHTACL